MHCPSKVNYPSFLNLPIHYDEMNSKNILVYEISSKYKPFIFQLHKNDSKLRICFIDNKLKINNFYYESCPPFSNIINISIPQMKQNRVFLPSSESLETAFKFISPEFQKLSTLLPPEMDLFSLSQDLQIFCEETFVLEDTNPPISYKNCDEVKRFTDIVNTNVRQLLSLNPPKTNYVQCFGQEFKDYSLHMKSFNFGKTILESCLLEKLNEHTGIEWTIKLIYNYSIVTKYNQNYFQVTGQQLPEQLKFKAWEKRKKTVNTNIYNYSTETILRFQMLYCTHTNRSAGLFRRNVFFDHGLKKSDFYQETKHLYEKQPCVLLCKRILKDDEYAKFEVFVYDFFTKTRDMFELKKQNNKNISEFNLLISRYCRLPASYQSIKKDVTHYLKTEQGNSEELFERMYAEETSYHSVYQLIRSIIVKIFPVLFLGLENLNVLLSMIKEFISMKRYENFKIEDILCKMDVFKVDWLSKNYNKKFKKQIINKKRRVLASIITMLFNNVIVPVLKLNFYITEKHKEANKLFYFRKPIWVLISKLALKKFSENNLEHINDSQYNEIKKSGTDYPEGKLRLMPKKGTFRPIITFNKKRKVENESYRATLNQILSDTQLVLRNLKNILGNEGGYCIFDNKQISRKYKRFIKKWRSEGEPKLVYFTLDIKKCYDSIDTSALVKIIEQTPYIEEMYLLVKYLRLYRNKKPLNETKSLPYYFNIKERIHATSLKNDPIEIYEDKSAAVNIFLARQKLITREEIIKKLKQLCDGSIVRYKKEIWLQKLGIPQGLNVSGVLCSLYFAYLEKKEVQVRDGLLMRLTDDYLYIGPQKEAENVLTSLLQCARQNSFVFNAEKIAKNFHHDLVENITNEEYIHWIGKKININTLEIFPALEKNIDKLAYAMNVNINRKQIKGFLKNKLKSLLTNHFSAYFNPQVHPLKTLLHVIRLYCQISLSKFFPFLVSLHKLNVKEESELIMKILRLTIHEFLIYACSFHEEQDRFYVYHKYLQTVLDEFTKFMKGKRSYTFMKPTERKFMYRLKKLNNEIKKYEEEHAIQE